VKKEKKVKRSTEIKEEKKNFFAQNEILFAQNEVLFAQNETLFAPKVLSKCVSQ
jgi:hypothetical protein